MFGQAQVGTLRTKGPPGESEAHFPKSISHFSGKRGVENVTQIPTRLPTALRGVDVHIPSMLPWPVLLLPSPHVFSGIISHLDCPCSPCLKIHFWGSQTETKDSQEVEGKAEQRYG